MIQIKFQIIDSVIFRYQPSKLKKKGKFDTVLKKQEKGKYKKKKTYKSDINLDWILSGRNAS